MKAFYAKHISYMYGKTIVMTDEGTFEFEGNMARKAMKMLVSHKPIYCICTTTCMCEWDVEKQEENVYLNNKVVMITSSFKEAVETIKVTPEYKETIVIKIQGI